VALFARAECVDMGERRPGLRRTPRGMAPLMAILIAVVVGALTGSGFVLFTAVEASSYCPFSTSSGMEFPTPGYTGNLSPNATSYANGTIVFTAGASGCVPPYTFLWNFGDGTYSNSPSVIHVYSDTGNFSGSLTTRDSAGHMGISYFCIETTDWPTLTGGLSSSPGCSWLTTNP
jgi:hypothetical protein